MGKTKTAFVGTTPEQETKALEKKRTKYEAKKQARLDSASLDSAKRARQARKVRVPGLGGGQRVVAVEAEPLGKPTPTETSTPRSAKSEVGPTTSKKAIVRGKKYLSAKAKIDPTRAYPLEEAVALAKQTSYSSFPGRLEVHLVLKRGTFNKVLALPYSAGSTKKIEITNEDTIKKLEGGKIDFDILIAHPSMMPKLVPFARILGPRGLMPNPKNGTISEKPEEAAKKFAGNSLQVKSEAKAPLIHTAVGRVNQPEKELVENLSAVLGAVDQNNIQRVFVKATMGPAVKVAVS